MVAVQSNGRQSLTRSEARNLATTTKTAPQMTAITPRWLLRLLPWVQVEAGTYRVNRRRVILRAPGRIGVQMQDGQARVGAQELHRLPLFQDVDTGIVESLAGQFVTERFDTGQAVIQQGEAGDKFYIVAHGKVEVSASGRYGTRTLLATLAEGDYFGEMALLEDAPRNATVTAKTPAVLLSLDRTQFLRLVGTVPGVRETLERITRERRETLTLLADEEGEKRIALRSVDEGEVNLPETFVEYEDDPREYSLNGIQTVLTVNTRIADLYSDPYDQLGEQLRLTIEAMHERKEWEILNDADFGLLNAAAPSMRVQTRTGPPTPDDMDELIERVWKQPAFFLAHPKAVAAFGRECTRRGVPPPTVEMFGSPFLTWRGIPIVPSNKVPVSGASRPDDAAGTTSILLMRVGEHEQGVVGLHQAGIAHEHAPSLSVRFMGINDKSIASYLLTLYHSAAVLTDDALGVLENVEVSSYYDYE